MQTLTEVLRDRYIVCSCEGNAEQAIIDLLLDAEWLCFSRASLIDKGCTQVRSGEKIAEKFLRMEMEKDIVIVRVLDRAKERFVLPRAHRMRGDIHCVDIVTRPEIEMIHIIAEGMYESFQKQRRHGLKEPSAYCKRNIAAGKNPKSQDFVYGLYGQNIDKLVDAIREYKRRFPAKEYGLADLLRE